MYSRTSIDLCHIANELLFTAVMFHVSFIVPLGDSGTSERRNWSLKFGEQKYMNFNWVIGGV